MKTKLRIAIDSCNEAGEEARCIKLKCLRRQKILSVLIALFFMIVSPLVIQGSHRLKQIVMVEASGTILIVLAVVGCRKISKRILEE